MHAITTAPAPTPSARNARRQRQEARRAAAALATPELRLGRVEPVTRLLRQYRQGTAHDLGALRDFVRDTDLEVRLLEAAVARRSRTEQREGASIRRALTLLKDFGRLGALDFDVLPVEARPLLVQFLALEYRWCFAAAGTTARAFKVAIGRTGAR